ncbi:MAG: hypothetical protein HY927_02705 [Elusimicrobia bacterium]|nr:hypothetical protein [Elusimicrobiota bacterium]
MSHDVWPAFLRPPMPAGRPDPGIYAVSGPRELAPRLLRGLIPSLAAGLEVFWVDAGNSFDAYGFGYACRAAGLDPRPLLGRIRLSRPFNLFQLETIVSRKLPDLWRGEPVVLADPFALLHGEEAPARDAERLWPVMLEAMRRSPVAWMVLAVARPPAEGRRDLRVPLERCARVTARLPCGEEG